MDDIICISVRFWDNALLVLKTLFLCEQKVTGLQWQEDINAVLISALSSTKLCLSLLKFQFLAKIFGEGFIMSQRSTSIPKEL